MFQGRDVSDDLETRSPKGGLRRAGHIAGGALNAAGTAATVASLFQGREVSDELEAREPKFNIGQLKRVGHGAGRILNGAGTAATVASMFQSREDSEEVDARDYEDASDLEARGRGLALGGAAFAAAAAGAGFGQMIAPIFKRPKNPTYRRDFEEDLEERDYDEEDMFERDFDEDELISREEFDELMERSPFNGAGLLKLGTALGKGVKYIVPAAGIGGAGLGIAAKLRSRSFDEGSMYEREVVSGLNELD